MSQCQGPQSEWLLDCFWKERRVRRLKIIEDRYPGFAGDFGCKSIRDFDCFHLDLAPEFGIPRPHCPVAGTIDFVTETTITGIRHDQVDVKGRLALIGQPSDLPHF